METKIIIQSERLSDNSIVWSMLIRQETKILQFALPSQNQTSATIAAQAIAKTLQTETIEEIVEEIVEQY